MNIKLIFSSGKSKDILSFLFKAWGGWVVHIIFLSSFMVIVLRWFIIISTVLIWIVFRLISLVVLLFFVTSCLSVSNNSWLKGGKVVSCRRRVFIRLRTYCISWQECTILIVVFILICILVLLLSVVKIKVLLPWFCWLFHRGLNFFLFDILSRFIVTI